MLFPGFLPAPEARAGATQAAGVWAEVARGESQSEERGKGQRRQKSCGRWILHSRWTEEIGKEAGMKRCLLAAVCSSLFCIWCLSQFPEGVPILWVMDQGGTSLMHLLPLVLRFSLPLSWLRCYWVTLHIYSRDTASPTLSPLFLCAELGWLKFLYPDSFQHQLNLSVHLQSPFCIHVVTRAISFSQKQWGRG